ncbi:MAG: FtsX-like permease family protein [Tannerellaceae bacterium]|nr:FtsX-like permease family protein [Tannerellaceae bacterium]
MLLLFFATLIAAINFTNISTSLAPQRIKSINTQKVLGSSDGVLRASLLIEAVAISFIACLLAVLLVYILNLRTVFTFVDAELSLFANLPIVIFTLILSLVIGLIAGMYPAWYITSFPPALVLKGNFGLTPKGKQLRTILIGFQFVVSIVLIIVTSFVYLQRIFMQNYTSGFDKDQIAIIELNQDIRYNHAESYKNNLKSYPGIEEVAFASDVIGVKDMYYMASFKPMEEEQNYFFVSVSPDFLR